MSQQPEHLPSMDADYALGDEQIRDYRANGHIGLRGLASPAEIAVYGDAIRTIVKELNYHRKPIHERDTYGKAFIQIGNVWEKSEIVRRFVMARRFAKVAAELMGVEGVRIYHDQALFKEPGGGHTPWHQDQIYWPFDSDKTITMWMPIVPVTEEMGSMTFASGSHEAGYINKLVISDESHRTLRQYIEAKGFGQTTYGAMAAGDATFHAGWTLHSAPGNPTDRMREVMTIIYYADGLKAAEPDSNARKADLAGWLPGVKPGELAASHLNPLVYRAAK
ncbi:phytanoyl-CoA dioxygenase family protein [Paenibacillus arenilitoris]|uniref:Phytanoyl-CoA dioxygenase family protein n=1 Tax=Paenibacillus arenilitoris TaxID=2772299 RepID=A0A927CQE8_9BACL|nr:phytanoyl-CoA dioxygenase family protein [Paenibacillus arenilitoris]MBD2871647.1 phytanoyl-CoA dioxygenase family protein [Paenibacillus arenilitoris]